MSPGLLEAVEALLNELIADGHNETHLYDDDGQNECAICATASAVRSAIAKQGIRP